MITLMGFPSLPYYRLSSQKHKGLFCTSSGLRARVCFSPLCLHCLEYIVSRCTAESVPACICTNRCYMPSFALPERRRQITRPTACSSDHVAHKQEQTVECACFAMLFIHFCALLRHTLCNICSLTSTYLTPVFLFSHQKSHTREEYDLWTGIRLSECQLSGGFVRVVSGHQNNTPTCWSATIYLFWPYLCY